ncbi:MAG: hypothetical protein K5908_04065 [Erysipelotrichaceae bacterium]|nr:hypothetical protein [Erysipelotrichaceae bacterium]
MADHKDHPFLMGIDGGTGGMRVGIYDPSGNCLAFSSVPYETSFPRPGYAQQRPEDWWSAAAAAVREALRKADLSPEQISAIACDTTSTSVVACRKDGTPLRPCIIWMDVRANKEAEELFTKTGEFYSPEWMPPKLAWLKRNEREIYDEAEVFCEYQDWLTYRLTGKWCMNINTACNWAYSVKSGFSKKIYEALDIADALDRFPDREVHRPGDLIGCLSKEAALHLGLREGTLIAQGGIDSSIGLLGIGVNRQGRIGMITGSSNLAMALNEKPLLNPHGSNNGPDNLIEGFYTDYVAQSASGSILSWFRKEFYPERSYKELDDLAKEVPIGSNGLLLLDYFQGNKHPYQDGKAKGMFYGLTLAHSGIDMYRAILEGVAFGTERILDTFREYGVDVKEMNMAGGSARSPLWMQIHADVSNIIINVPEDLNAPNLGCAICCAVMLKIYPDLPTAVDRMVRYQRSYCPDPEAHSRYMKIYELYKRFYPLNRDWIRDFADTFEDLNG